MPLSLEDFFEDILGKAQFGLGIDTGTLAEKTGLDRQQIQQLRRGEPDEAALRKVAPHLQLHPDALVDSANKSWYPDIPQVPCLTPFTSSYGDMLVNAYLYQIPGTSQALLFDTGTDAVPILQHLRDHNLTLAGICLTHYHPDHIAELLAVSNATGNPPAWIHKDELVDGALGIEEGWEHSPAPGFRITALKTSGHSPAGVTYLLHLQGQSFPIAMVGDAMFAGSMGGGRHNYQDALENNRKKILTLPDETPICPGHGPLSTVGQEKLHNPFFPEFKP